MEQSRQVERAERFAKLWAGWFKSFGRYTPIPRKLRRQLARMAAKGKVQLGGAIQR